MNVIKTMGLKVVVLHEKPQKGRTIIEKLEANASVEFAVVILTPDDKARAARSRKGLKSRARQNVMLELGYFVAKLGRKRVCTLYKKDVELPSDWAGVGYVELDRGGKWQSYLRRELNAAGLRPLP